MDKDRYDHGHHDHHHYDQHGHHDHHSHHHHDQHGHHDHHSHHHHDQHGHHDHHHDHHGHHHHDHYGKKLVVRRRLLRVQRVVGEQTKTKTVQATVRLPVQAIKVFEVQASLRATKCEIKRDGVFIQGIVHKQVFYVDQGDLVRHVGEEVPFHFFVDVEGAESRMTCQAHTKIVSVDWTLSRDGHEVVQDVAVRAFVKVTEVEQMEVVVDVRNHKIKVDKELLRVESVVGEDTVRETITNTIKLPMKALKIFDVKAEVRDVNTTLRNDSVTIKGVIHKQIFFVDEGNLVRHQPEDVPFSITADIPGASKDMEAFVDVRVMVDDFKLRHVPGHSLRQTMIVEAFIKVVEPLQIQVVTNVKGPHIIVDRRLLKVDHVVTEDTKRESINSEVCLPMQALKIFSIMARLEDVTSEVKRDSVIVRGTIHKQVFFVDMGNLLRHHSEDVPFRMVLDTPGSTSDMSVHVRANIIGEVEYSLKDGHKHHDHHHHDHHHDHHHEHDKCPPSSPAGAGQLLTQAVIVEAFVKVTEPKQLQVVVDVKEKAIPKPPPHHPPHVPECPSMKFHVVQKGESLWSIAQRHGVSLEALLAANPTIKHPELIYPGQKICIPIKVSGKG
ncbi:MAG TPA: SPOCS domain-containing protein [bacterium]|nr:SPOCS domain-containing protein [bacterium]